MSAAQAVAPGAVASLPPTLAPPHRRPVLTLYSLPLPLGKRLRLTSIAVSPSLLVLGTNSGSLYFYSRPSTFPLPSLSSLSPPLSSPLASRALPLPAPSFLRLVTLELPPSSPSSLSHLHLSPHHPHLLAAATGTALFLLHCSPLVPSLPHRVLHTFPLSSPPTCVSFSPEDCAKRCVLYYGDDSGAVHRLSLPFPHSVLHRPTAELLLRLDPPLVQLTALPSHLLLSTPTRSYVSPYTSSKADFKAVPIGSKPRSAAYTVCVDPSAPATGDGPSLLASRPGRRLWKADCSGTVLSTLILQPPLPSVFTPLTSPTPLPLPATFSLNTVNFTHLLPFAQTVVSYTPSSPHLLVIDVGRVEVVDFFVSFGRLLHVQAEGRSLFVLHEREEGGDAELSIVQATSPYSHLQRLLTEAGTTQPVPLPALLLTAVKYRVYDRALVTQLQRMIDDSRATKAATGEDSASPEELSAFAQLVVEAERSERTARREDHWDDDGLTAADAAASAATIAIPSPLPPPPAPSASVDGATAPLTSLFSSSARRVLTKWTQPSLTSAKEKDREGETTTTAALPASPKPSLLERTAALLSSHSTPPAAPPAAPAAPLPELSPQPLHPPINPFQLSATHPRESVGSSAAAALLMGSSSSAELSSTPPSSDSAAPPSTGPLAVWSTSSSSVDANSASLSSALPLPLADVEAFSRASLLPAENLPFAEPQVEVGLEGERRGGGDRRRRKAVVDVSAEGEEAARRERERKRREKREAERRRVVEREKKAADHSAAPRSKDAVEPHTPPLVLPQQDAIANSAATAPPAVASAASAEDERGSVDDTAVEGGKEEEQSLESRDAPLTDVGDEEEEEDADDEVSVLLRPSSFSLLSTLRSSPLSPFRPLLRSMRWTLTSASVFCREHSTSFTPLEGEDVFSCRQQRWTAAQERTIPSESSPLSLESLVAGWVDRFSAEVDAAADWDEEEEKEEEEQGSSGKTPGTEVDRVASFRALLASAPPLLLQELSSLVLLRLHLLVLAASAAPPPSDSVSPFIARFRALLDPVLTFSYLRHYRHPLCFQVPSLFHLPLPTPSTSDPLSCNALFLAARLSELSASPSAALAEHLSDSFPHVQPWMVTRALAIDADTQLTALALPSPLPLAPSLHALASAEEAGEVQLSAVDVRLNFYRAYLDCLLCRLPPSPLLDSARQDRVAWRQWLQLTLRLGMPPLSPSAAVHSAPPRGAHLCHWPFLPSIDALVCGRVQCPIGVEELSAALEAVGCFAAFPALHRRRLKAAPSVGLFASALQLTLQLDDFPSALLLLDDLSASSLSLHSRLAYAKAALDSFADRWTAGQPTTEEGRAFHSALHSLLLALGPPLLLQLLLALPADSPLLALLPFSFPSSILSHSQSLFSLSRTSLALLETVDSALWAERVDSLSPQIRAIALHEMEQGWMHKLTRAPTVPLAQTSQAGHVASHTAPWSRWGEDGGGGEWGRRVCPEGLRCGCCGVAVEWSSGKAGGVDEDAVIAFECDGGHVYHRRCLPELACLLCLDRRMSGGDRRSNAEEDSTRMVHPATLVSRVG